MFRLPSFRCLRISMDFKGWLDSGKFWIFRCRQVENNNQFY